MAGKAKVVAAPRDSKPRTSPATQLAEAIREIALAEMPRETFTLTSQRTSLARLGVPSDNFLDDLPAYKADGNEVIVRGRLRLVVTSDYVAWLRERQHVAGDAANEAIDDEDPAEAYARSRGFVAIAGGRR